MGKSLNSRKTGGQKTTMMVTLKFADGREMFFSHVKDIGIFKENSESKEITQNSAEKSQAPTEGEEVKAKNLKQHWLSCIKCDKEWNLQ